MTQREYKRKRDKAHATFFLLEALLVMFLFPTPWVLTVTIITGYAHGRVIREMRNEYKNGNNTDELGRPQS